jgi:superfamily II DNA or RNA helicase
VLYLRATNSTTYVEIPPCNKLEYKRLYTLMREVLSYEVPSAEWSNKFKTGNWDGTISLYNGREKSFPSGLTDHVIERLTELEEDFEWSDERELPNINASFTTNYGNKKLRYYQDKYPKLAKEQTRGILSMGTGAGKTVALCELLCQLQCAPAVIIVPGITLLKQTAGTIESYIKNKGKSIKVGRIGGGDWDIRENGINVCTYQSALAAHDIKYLLSSNKLEQDEFAGEKNKKSIPDLEKDLAAAKLKKDAKLIKKNENLIRDKKETLSKKRQFQSLLEECQVFIVDECHLASVIIEFLSKQASSAYYKFGLSATPWREDNQEMRIEGALGRIICDVSSSELIQKGYLCKPTILMFKMASPSNTKGYAACYADNIINNDSRNEFIAQAAEEAFANHLPTVILVERLEHGKILSQLMPRSVFVPGKEKGEDDPTEKERDYRRQMLDKLARNEIILIATQWIYTGIDCPAMQCLILAGSCSSSITTYQQVGRALRLSPETHKDYAIVIDFDDSHQYLAAHARNRRKTYKREPEYNLMLLKSKKG